MAARKKTARKNKAASKRAKAKPKAKKRAAKKTATKKKAAAGRPKTGTKIERTFKGAKHTVTVTADGYAHKGTTYRSLTALAKKITGYAAVSGPRFFGTDKASKSGGTK